MCGSWQVYEGARQSSATSLVCPHALERPGTFIPQREKIGPFPLTRTEKLHTARVSGLNHPVTCLPLSRRQDRVQMRGLASHSYLFWTGVLSPLSILLIHRPVFLLEQTWEMHRKLGKEKEANWRRNSRTGHGRGTHAESEMTGAVNRKGHSLYQCGEARATNPSRGWSSS